MDAEFWDEGKACVGQLDKAAADVPSVDMPDFVQDAWAFACAMLTLEGMSNLDKVRFLVAMSKNTYRVAYEHGRESLKMLQTQG